MKLSPCHHDNQDNLPAHLAFVHSSVVSVASPCYQLSSPSHCAPSAPSPCKCRKEWSPVFSGVCVLLAIAPLEVLVNVNMAQ